MSSEEINTDGAILHWSDYVVIAGYFIGVLAVGYWSSKRIKGNSVDGYFLANRNMHWIPVGASLFATTIGSDAFVGLAGAGANSGIGIAAIELHAMFIMLVLGWFFVPVYISSGVNTMPEYLKKRFGGQRIRIYLSVISLFLFIFLGISVDLYSGSLFIEQAMGLNMYLSIVILIAMAALLTIKGGLNAVLWTDSAQTVIMFAGAVLVMVLSMIEVGGYENLFNTFQVKSQPTDPQYIGYVDNCNPANNSCVSCSAVTKYYKNLIRPPTDPEMPSTGIVFGLTISAVWFWCTNQATVQRVLSAKNVSHAKAGCTLCSLLKVSNVFLVVLTGMAARVLWPNEIGCSNPEKCKQLCGSELGCSNLAYPYLILRLMPKGATGLMLSVMIAALMSSLTSIFNSASTIFSLDLYPRVRKNASELELVIVGRIFVLLTMCVSILWIPVIQASNESQLFHYIQSIISFLAPPICAVFVLGVFWSRTNETGAFWSLMFGLVLGILRFTMEFAYSVPTCASGEPDLRPFILSKIHYLHFGAILFLITSLVAISISLLTEPIPENKLYRLTYFSRFSEEIRFDFKGREVSTHSNNNFGDKLKDQSFINKNNMFSKFISTVCCINSEEDVCDNRSDLTNDTNTMNNKNQLSGSNAIKEIPLWNNLNNLFAVIVIAFASFIWGFYA